MKNEGATRRHRGDRGKSAIGVSLVAFLFLSGCTVSTVEDFRNVRALIDQEAGTIALPLDSYALNPRQQLRIEHANTLLVAECMGDEGRPYPRADEDWESLAPFPERRFGLWLRSQAEVAGYDIPREMESLRIDELEQTYPEDWWTAAFRCIDATGQLPLMGTELNGESISIAARGTIEASQDSLEDPGWSQALVPWINCLEENGIAPTDSVTPVPRLPDDLEAQARVALLDVECKQEHGTVQALADIVAQHQAAYVSAHENELDAYKSEGLEVLSKADAVIDRLG